MTEAEFAAMVLAIVIGLVCRSRFLRKQSRAEGRSADGPPVVTVAVRDPIMPVPGLIDAYAALPPHCQAVLGR